MTGKPDSVYNQPQECTMNANSKSSFPGETKEGTGSLGTSAFISFFISMGVFVGLGGTTLPWRSAIGIVVAVFSFVTLLLALLSNIETNQEEMIALLKELKEKTSRSPK